jgi:hypothetical protein
LEESPQILVKNENIEDVKLVSSIEDSSPSSSSSKSSIVHLVEEKGGGVVVCDKPNIEFSDDSSSNVNTSDSNLNTGLAKEVINSNSHNHSLMIVDSKLDDENKENHIVHNLENINNNLAEVETPRNVEIVGSTLEEIGNDCQKDSISKPGPILEPRETSLSFSEEKIKLIENQVKSNVKDAHFEPNTKKSSATESENNNIIKCV